MSRRGCPGAASGDSWGQNRLGSRARSETIPRGQRARAPGGEVGAGCPARPRRTRVGSAGRAGPARPTSSDRAKRACRRRAAARTPWFRERPNGARIQSLRGVIQSHPLRGAGGTPRRNPRRARRLATPGPRLYPSMAVSRCEARSAGTTCTRVYARERVDVSRGAANRVPAHVRASCRDRSYRRVREGS